MKLPLSMLLNQILGRLDKLWTCSKARICTNVSSQGAIRSIKPLTLDEDIKILFTSKRKSFRAAFVTRNLLLKSIKLSMSTSILARGRPYICNKVAGCGKTFRQRASYFRHIKNQHKDQASGTMGMNFNAFSEQEINHIFNDSSQEI